MRTKERRLNWDHLQSPSGQTMNDAYGPVWVLWDRERARWGDVIWVQPRGWPGAWTDLSKMNMMVLPIQEAEDIKNQPEYRCILTVKQWEASSCHGRQRIHRQKKELSTPAKSTTALKLNHQVLLKHEWVSCCSSFLSSLLPCPAWEGWETRTGKTKEKQKSPVRRKKNPRLLSSPLQWAELGSGHGGEASPLIQVQFGALICWH